MNRADILHAVEATILHDRQNIHGQPEDTHAAIADLWEIYLGHKYQIDVPLTAEDAAVMMVLFKVARVAVGKPNIDNFLDMTGYAAVAGELAFPKIKGSATAQPERADQAVGKTVSAEPTPLWECATNNAKQQAILDEALNARR